MTSAVERLSGKLSSGFVVGIAAVLVFVCVGSAFAANETYDITMQDYSYTPNQMTWHVGDTVTITLTNKSTDKEHELLFGKDVNYSTDSFGNKYPDGWKTKLFESAGEVQFLQGDGIAELRADGPGTVALETKGGHVTYTFKVPDKPGQWEFGCFEENGSHFGDHNMKGTVTIVK